MRRDFINLLDRLHCLEKLSAPLSLERRLPAGAAGLLVGPGLEEIGRLGLVAWKEMTVAVEGDRD